MVGNYLDLARLESGEMRFRPVADVNFRDEVLQFALDTVIARAEQRGSRIAVTQPQAAPHLAADPDLLRIVTVNLLDNAVKYGHEKIEVKVEVRVEEGWLVVSVWNEGVGFTPEQATRLFKRFSRLQQKGTEDRRGSGLGLYLTWWIVQKHGGRIQAESEPGAWARFTVRLPGVRADEATS